MRSIISRRSALAVLALAIGLGNASARAQDAFPTDAITLVVPFTAGGPTDGLARTLARGMGEALGQTVLVENKPGAGGNVGALDVVNSAPDGYKILFASSGPLLINASLYADAGYDPLTDYTPIALAGEMPNVVVVNPSLGIGTLPEFLDHVRATEGLIYGSSGYGSTNHVSAFLLNKQVGDRLTHVPYTGTAQALNDLLGGHITVMYVDVMSALPYVQGGELTALAIDAPERSPILPDVPTFADEIVESRNLGLAFGIVGPAGLPETVVGTLNRSVESALASDAVRSAFERQGVRSPSISTPEQFADFISREVGHWAEVVQLTGVTVD